MAYPKVASINLSRNKLSRNSGTQKCIATITFDSPIKDFKVNTLGVSHDTGTIAHRESKLVTEVKKLKVSEVKAKTVRELRLFEAGHSFKAEIDYNELSSEGNNRLNVYGLSLTDEWTHYDCSH